LAEKFIHLELWYSPILVAEKNSLFQELFRATVESTEEAILNALVAAETMVGINRNRVEAISKDKLQALFRNR